MLLESKEYHDIIKAQEFIDWVVKKKEEVKLPIDKTFTDTASCPCCGELVVIHFVPLGDGNKIITMGGCQTKGCFHWSE